jgi:diguanylate cyclase (GGDEF)-like protein/PAS domain S-box-containing protein
MKLDFRELLSDIGEGVYFTDTSRHITYWNKSAERITGFAAQEVVGKQCSDNVLMHVDERGCSLCKSLCPLARSMKDLTAGEAKIYLHHKQGHRIPVVARVTPLHDDQGNLVGGAEFFTDVSNQEILAERLRELERLALLDALTGLPNRHHLLPELSARFHERNRLKLDFGMIFLDVDNFKRINDSLGHHVGDILLKTVANTLKASVRPFDLVGRWGGDEFLCIVRNTDSKGLERIAQRLLSLLNKSTVSLNGSYIHVSASIGVTMAEPEDTDESLFQRADTLMYASKQKGGNRITCGSSADLS